MHTATSKQILTPLAEAVFQLILIISEAEIDKCAIPDLSQLAKVVDSQIVNLVSVGTKIQNQQAADAKLKHDMPKACKEVTKASMKLVGGTEELKNDPYSQNGQKELLESVKGILAGTANVLYAFDAYEVRKIVHIARLCSMKVNLIKSEPLQPQQVIQCLMQVSQIVVQLAQQTNKRVAELLSPVLQQRLKIAVEELSRESPLLITSTKAVLASSSNVHAKDARNQTIDRLMDICLEIEIVVQIVEGEDMVSSQLDKAFQNLLNSVKEDGDKMLQYFKRQDVKGAKESLDRYMNGNDQLKGKTKEHIDRIEDPKLKEELENLLNKIEAQLGKLSGWAEDLLKDPKDEEKLRELAGAIAANASLWDKVAEKKNDKSFANLLKQSGEKGTKTINALRTKDLKVSSEAFGDYNAIAKDLRQLSIGFMENSKDPNARRKIQKLLTITEDDENKMIPVVDGLESNPNQPAKIDELAKIFANTHNAWNEIDKVSKDNAKLKFDEAREKSKTEGRKMSKALKALDTDQAMDSYEKHLGHNDDLKEQIEDMIAKHNDSAKKGALKAKLDRINKEEGKVKELTKTLLKNPDSPAKIQELDAALEDLDKSFAAVSAKQFRKFNDPVFDRLVKETSEAGQRILDAFKRKDIVAAKQAFDEYLVARNKVGERAQEYLDKTSDPELKKEIQDLLDKFNKDQETLMALVQSLLADPASSENIEGLKHLLSEEEKTQDLIADKNQKSNKGLHALQKDIDDAAEKMMESLKNDKIPEAKAAYEAYKAGSLNFKHANQDIVALTDDPKQKEKMNSTIERLEGVEKDIGNVAAEAFENSTPKLQKSLQRKVDLASKLREKATVEANKALVGEISRVANELNDRARDETALGNMYAKSADGSLTEEAKNRFKEQSNKLGELTDITAAIASEVDPQLANTLSLASTRLQNLEPSVETALQSVNENPKDSGTKEYADGVTTVYEDNVKDIVKNTIGQEGVFSVLDIVNGTKKNLENQIAQLERSIAERDLPESVVNSKKIVSAAREFLNTAKREQENTSDEGYKGQLVTKMSAVEQDLLKIQDKSGILLKAHEWPDLDASELFGLAKSLARNINDLGQVIQTQHGYVEDEEPVEDAETPMPNDSWKEEVSTPQEPEEPQEEEEEEEEEPKEPEQQEEPEEEQPKLLSEEEAIANPIKAVAQELLVETSQWDKESNPIVSGAHDISSALEELSRFHMQLLRDPTPEAKKGFINAAKKILECTQVLVSPAKSLADECTDKRLQRQLKNGLDRISTLSQQLKIVAAVKASAPSDTDRDKQLIACAQNLVTSIKSCLKDCDTVVIKGNAQAITIQPVNGPQSFLKKPVAASFVFKRKVFRNR